MQNGFITKAEQEALEEKVAILFQKRSDGSDYTAELEYVREKTKLLLYLIPRRSYYLDRELCSEFYLSQLPGVDRIIMSYRITLSVPYVAYLHVILKGRAFAFMSKKYERMRKDDDFLYTSVNMLDASEVFEFEPEWDAMPSSDGPPARPPEELSLNEIIEDVVTAVPCTHITGNLRRDIMLEYLRERDNRLRFMLFLLSNTDSLTSGEIRDLSELMNVSEHSFAELSTLLFSKSEKRQVVKEERLDGKINRAWKRYVLLTAAIHNPKTSEEEKKELRVQLEAALRRVRSNQESKAGRRRGLTIAFIARALSFSEAMVSSSIRQVKSFMEALSTEVRAGA